MTKYLLIFKDGTTEVISGYRKEFIKRLKNSNKVSVNIENKLIQCLNDNPKQVS